MEQERDELDNDPKQQLLGKLDGQPKVQRFNLKCAHRLLGEGALSHPGYSISKLKVEQCFEFSMMTILNEESNMKKYEWLHFVEFLEMLCRIAIVAITKAATVEYKVESLLQIVLDEMHRCDLLDKQEFVLQPVDEELVVD